MAFIVHQAVFVGVGCFEAIMSVLDYQVGCQANNTISNWVMLLVCLVNHFVRNTL